MKCNFLDDCSKAVLLLRINFVICVCLCLCLMSCLFLAALLSPVGKRLTSWLSCFSCVFVSFPYGVLGQVWCLIVSFPDLCLLPYLVFLKKPIAL